MTDNLLNYLMICWKTGSKFPPNRRHADVSFWAHAAAGNPDTLDEIVEIAKQEGKEVTPEYVHETRARLRK